MPRARRVADALMAAAVPIGGHVHARLGPGRAVGLGYVGRSSPRYPRGRRSHETVKVAGVLGCRGGVGVGGWWRGGDVLGRGGGLGSEGWGGGAGCGGGAVSAFRAGCAGARWRCRGAVLCGICCRICVGAVFGLACVAVRGVEPRLLLRRLPEAGWPP